jgi:hypothetical protein
MASFSEALYTLSAERLRALVQARGVALSRFALTPSKRQLVQDLASELSKPESIVAAIAQCNARELRLLQLLLPDDNQSEIAWERVLEAAGGPALDEALSAVMTRLEDLGLAFRLPGGVFLPSAIRNQVPASLPDRYTLTRCLNAYDAQTLKRIYHNLGLEGEPGSNPEIIAAIRARLLPGDPGVHLRTPLDEEEVAVLEYLVQVGGWASAADVTSAVLPDQIEDFFRYNWQNRWKQGRARNAIDRLMARGILHVVAHGYALNLYLLLPGDLLRALTGDVNTAFWTRPLDLPTPLPTPPAAVTRHTGLLRDVVSLLAHVLTQDAVRTNTGHIHKASLKTLTRSLSLPEERYAAFLYALCRQARLIEPRGEKQVYALTEQGETWLTADAPTQAQSLYEAWRDGPIWAEMYNDPLFKADDYRPIDRILRMRHATLGLLTASPLETFADIGSLTDVLAFRHPLLLAQSAAMGPDLVASPAVFVRRLVGECLYWLGLAELGWTEATAAGQSRAEDSLTKAASSKSASGKSRGQVAHRPPEPEMTAYRLTPLSAYLLGMEGASAPEPEPREDKFLLQANAEIFVPPYLEPTILYPLLLLTEAPGKGATGNVVRLTRESIRAALDRGMTSREIIAFLQSSTRTGIPQNIEYLINEVADRHGHIHIGRAQMYLQVDSPLLLQELQARREFKPYAIHILSDTVALLQADDVEKVLRDLRKAGYAPVSDDAPAAHPILLTVRPPTQALTPVTPASPRKHLAPAESGLDWKRIAQEDGLPWNTAPAATPSRKSKPATAPLSTNEPPPADGVTDVARITTLLTQAARNRRCVEISYRRQNEPTNTRRIIAPRVILGDFVSAYCRQSQAYDSFNIKRMQWARLTDETFEA